MNINLNIKNLIRQILPPHKRQPKRLAFLWQLLGELQNLFDNFYAWREETRILVNVNAQVMILEGYLRKKYNDPTINIYNATDGLLLVCLEKEGTTMMAAFGTEEADFTEVSLFNEPSEESDVDFIVRISTDAADYVDQIDAEIQKYKPALTTYKIIQS